MNVADSPPAQLHRKRLPVELRIVTRTGNRAHVNDALDLVRPQQFKKRLPGPRRMPDGKYGSHLVRVSSPQERATRTTSFSSRLRTLKLGQTNPCLRYLKNGSIPTES